MVTMLEKLLLEGILIDPYEVYRESLSHPVSLPLDSETTTDQTLMLSQVC